MTNTKIIEKLESISGNIDLSKWKTVLLDNLDTKQQEMFYKRKEAVDLYIEHKKSVIQISNITHFHPNEIRRYIKRCLSLDENGEAWGYRALLPNKRIKNYERKKELTLSNSLQDKSIKFTGAFTLLLDTYPRIKEKIIELYLNKDKRMITDPIISPKYLHKKFIRLCHDEQIKETEYPFNTKDLAKRSFYRFLKKIESEFIAEASKRRGEDVHRHLNSTGVGFETNVSISRPFQRVQFDGHRIDTILSITFNTPEGDEVSKVMDRIWLLVIIDVATRVILGYHICLNKEYSSHDVLHCIKNAIVPKQKKSLSISQLKYPEENGFASLSIKETQWALWDEFLYDNAKANLAENVRNKLTQIVGCSVNAGPVKMPERRGLVERFFGTLEENGYHRLSSTTGSNPKDPRRQDAEKKAIKYQISAKHLEEITEILIANYNLTPHDGIYGFKPLELMKQRIERGLLPRTMPVEKQNDIIFLSLKVQRSVQGSINSGKRPYIYYEGVEYRNDILSRSPDLIGTKLDLLVNLDDLRVLKAFLPDGSEFGTLTATGKWGIKPHSLQTRKQINKLKANKLLYFTQMDDPIEIYHQYLSQSAISKKSSRNRLAEVQRKEKNSVEKKSIVVEEKTNIQDIVTNKTDKTELLKEQAEKQKKIEELRKSKAYKTYNF